MMKLQKVLIWLLIAGSILGLFYKLDQQYLWTDEVFSFHAAERIVETGESVFETGFPYDRSPIYHKIVAISMSLSEDDVWASRVINIPFILLTSILLYLLQRDEKDVRKKLIPVLLYLSANFTLAMVRETRMYAMTTAIFTLMLFTFIKAYVAPLKKTVIKIWKLEYTIDILWAILFGAVTLLGILHHPILLLFGLALLSYFVIEGVLEKKPENILLILTIVVSAFMYTYLKYGDFDLIAVFALFSPDLGESSYIYYLILIARNFPWMLALSPILIIGALKDRSRQGIFINTVLAIYLILLSLQEAKHERYLQVLLPILLFQSINYIFTFKDSLKNQTLFIRDAVKILIILLILSTHSYLYIKELNEITTYTEHSIALQKKFDLREAAQFTQQFENVEVIADFHSAFTLMSQGIKVKKIVVTKDHPELARGEEDVYYGIDFIIYPDELLKELNDKAMDILIIRDFETYPELAGDRMEQVEGFDTPRVFVER